MSLLLGLGLGFGRLDSSLEAVPSCCVLAILITLVLMSAFDVSYTFGWQIHSLASSLRAGEVEGGGRGASADITSAPDNA
jgi:hypothetical protein